VVLLVEVDVVVVVDIVVVMEVVVFVVAEEVEALEVTRVEDEPVVASVVVVVVELGQDAPQLVVVVPVPTVVTPSPLLDRRAIARTEDVQSMPITNATFSVILLDILAYFPLSGY